MAQTRSISTAAAGLATGAITRVLAAAQQRTGAVPDAGDQETYRKALRLLDAGKGGDPNVVSLARELIRSRLAA